MIVNELTVNTLRFLSVEAIQKAKSGHPGLPLGAAPMALALWGGAMKHNPKNPNWPNRDRFILSAGHGSALLYSLLHVFGYSTARKENLFAQADGCSTSENHEEVSGRGFRSRKHGVEISDLQNFRQAGGITPGHPEYGHTPGVEITTGPLGQGIANGVGFAWAESHMAAKFNKPDAKIVDHFTFVLCGDGCLQEGVAAEAVSLAGTLGLGKLIVLYDSNNITIEGSTDTTFSEDVGKRFEACGWHVQKVADGNDLAAIGSAIDAAKQADKPSLIEIKTIIGFGAPKQGTAGVHGSPLGDDGIASAKASLGWPHTEAFFVPEEVKKAAAEWLVSAQEQESGWNRLVEHYKQAHPESWREWETWHSAEPSVNFEKWDEFWQYEGNLATRASSEVVLNRLAERVPNLVGGSADLAPSTLTVMKNRAFYSKDTPCGSNLQFGVREHAMTAIANAFAAYGGLRPYVAGFFVFSDYMKPAMRLAALMKLPVIYVLTHDSIGVGEDGPTHQPVEHLAALRSIPGFTVFRPCDTKETAAAWAFALKKQDGPTAIVLSRQSLPLLPETGKTAMRGAYILKDDINPATGKPDILLMASGSEVELIYNAGARLKEAGIHARIISAPALEEFERQSDAYKEEVMPRAVRTRLAVEAASTFGWHKYTGLDGDVLGIDSFGASAPASVLLEEFGMTVDEVVERAKRIL